MSSAQGIEYVIRSQETTSTSDGSASFCFMDGRGTIGAGGCAADPVRSLTDATTASGNLAISEQRVGRCMCAKDAGVRKPTLKKRVEIQPSGLVAAGARNSCEPAATHLVPKVQVFTSSANCGAVAGPPTAVTTIGAVKVSDTHDNAQVTTVEGSAAPLVANNTGPQLVLVPAIKKVNRATNTSDNHSADIGPSGVTQCAPCKPILTNSIQRNHWNNSSAVATSTSMEVVGIDHDVHQLQQQPRTTCLRRYGSSQSCKSATTLRSVTSSSRGMMKGRYVGQTSGDSYSEELDRDEVEDEKIPGGPGLNERELWSLHRAVPALRRHDPRTSTMRQHYYPEGGWGWLVVGAAFLVQVLTTGLQFAFGVMATQIVKQFRRESTVEVVWRRYQIPPSRLLWVRVDRNVMTRLLLERTPHA